jgi:multidrug efflux pump subunit AcrA (membrane-fusion protein)
MSTDTRNQNDAAEQVKQQVRNTIQELRNLVRASISFEEFCQTLLAKAVPLTGAYGAIIWRGGGENGQLVLAASHGPRADEIHPNHPAHMSMLLDAATKQHSLVVPSEALGLFNGMVNAEGQRPGEMLLLVSPVFDRKKNCWGVIELLQRPDIVPAAQQGYLKFLGELAGLFPRWHEQNDLRKMSSSETNWSSRLAFAKEVHRSTELEPTAYAVANEARRLLNADRTSIAIWDGSQCKIRAISSQDRFDNRANVVKRLRAVTTAAVRSSTPLWLTGDTSALPPNVANLVNNYLDEAHSRTLAVIPLEEYQPPSSTVSVKRAQPKRKRKLGALVLEYFDREVPREAHEEDLQLVVDEGSVALTNALETNDILFLPLLRWLGGVKRFLLGDHLSKTLTALAALSLFTAFMCLWPTQMRLKIDGVLQPEIRRNLFTELDGVVEKVNVDHNSVVRKGDLLLELNNEPLRLKALELSGQIKTNREQVDGLRRQQLQQKNMKEDERLSIAGRIEQLEIQNKSLEEQLTRVERQLDSLKIYTPIDGTVLTWEARRRLDQLPVQANQPVLSVADLNGPWQVELMIPQNRVGYVTRALQESKDGQLKTEFVLATNPNVRIQGRLLRIAERAEADPNGALSFRAVVEVDKQSLTKPQPGAGVSARVNCGWQPIGFGWFFQIVDFVRTHLWF